MQAILLFGLAYAGTPPIGDGVPPIPEATSTGLVPVAADKQAALDRVLADGATGHAYAYHRRFTSVEEAEMYTQHAVTALPGDDLLFVMVDEDRDGAPEHVDVAVGVDASIMGGAAWRVDRPLLLDTNGDSRIDRFVWSKSVASLPWDRVAAR